MNRSSGILLHITSLPGEGIGTIGSEAFAFVDFLVDTGQHLWQILPLNPVGFGNSPYQSFSAFAGNPLLISLETLVKEGLLDDNDLQAISQTISKKVDFEKITPVKEALLKKAYTAFCKNTEYWQNDYLYFLAEHSWWLDDYCLFMALKKDNESLNWNKWEPAIRKREQSALSVLKEVLLEETDFYRFVQFMFFRQWFRLKSYANSKGIKIIGDLPLYVSFDSVDVWSNQDIFLLDEEGNMLFAGGVPPDMFSKDGQLWGCPVYDWDHLSERHFDWWLARLHFNMKLYDEVRVDHFLGLESFWSVPAGELTAKNGKWVKAKGAELLSALKLQCHSLPLIAEDLGIITPKVDKLRTDFNLPGMKILQFAFAGDHTGKYLPHNYTADFVVYTGTHDNDTLLGWLKKTTKEERSNLKKYYGTKRVHNRLIEAAWASVAQKAIIPLQDLLKLDSEARMNTPGTVGDNWNWRFNWPMISNSRKKFLKDITIKYNRRFE